MLHYLKCFVFLRGYIEKCGGRGIRVSRCSSSISQVKLTIFSWSRNGRKLASSAADGRIHLYDVMSGTVEKVVSFKYIIVFAQIHPRNK